MGKVNVLGMGPGHRDYYLPISLKKIEESHVLIGGKRILRDFVDSSKEIIYINKELNKIVEYIKQNKDSKTISVLLSGDTGFYSMLTFLKKHFNDEELEVIPGISSYQYLMAKLKKSWQGSYIGSVHGRELNIVNVVSNNQRVILLTDNKNTPANIAKRLLDNNVKNKIMYVGENLSYENERIVKGSLKEISTMEYRGMAVVVIEDE